MMSNCSRHLLADLLAALASEWAQIGAEIAGLGEDLAATRDSVVAMQGFDALSQNAETQGRLLAQLSVLARGRTLSRPDVMRIVDHLPLPAVRRRLLAAVDMRLPEDGTETEIWGVP
jgi:hypothetical protein